MLAWHRAWGWYADDELRTRRVRADGTLGVTAGVASNIFGTDLDADSAGNVSFVWTAGGGVSSTRRRSVSGSMTAAEELSR